MHDPQRQSHQQRGADDDGQGVPEDEVPDLVPDDELDFIRLQSVHQRVPEHDALRAAEARHVRVHLSGLFALPHLVDPAVRDSRPRGEVLDAVLEGGVAHPAVLVEQRRDVDRQHDHDQHGERGGEQAGPEPPAPGADPQQPIGDPRSSAENTTVIATALVQYPATRPPSRREAVGVLAQVSGIPAQRQEDERLDEDVGHGIERDRGESPASREPLGGAAERRVP